MKAGVFGLAVVLLAGCQNAPGGEDETSYSGLYRQGFEQSDFYPDSRDGPWWFAWEGDVWEQIEPFMTGEGRGVSAVVRMTVAGQLSDEGRYGHLGAYKRELIATRIISIEPSSEEAFAAAAEQAAGR